MGNSASAIAARGPQKSSKLDIETLATFSYGLCTQEQVHHYMPPTLPIVARSTPYYVESVVKSWDAIKAASTERMRAYSKPGVVLFYDEFFFRLFQRDDTFNYVFSDLKTRARIIMVIMSYVTSVRADNPEQIEKEKNNCRFLGHKHRNFVGVRPHQFSVLTTVLLEVIMFWLDDLATPGTAEAWSNIFGFVLKYLLEPYLHDRVDPYECYQNTQIAAVREIESSSQGDNDLTSARSARSGVDRSGRV